MLRELTVSEFRNIPHLTLSPAPHLNLILGSNGAGKSALLEAVDFLSRGRTFRTRQIRALIREGSQCLTVSALLSGGGRLGTRRGGKGGEIVVENRLDGERVSTQAEMASALPVLVFCAEQQKHAAGESKHWQNILDWGVFHMKPLFCSAWRNYRRALRQRNTLLRTSGGSVALRRWEQPMDEQSEQLDSLRRAYAEPLIAWSENEAAQHRFPLRIHYARGWPEGDSLASVLIESESEDRRVGYTRYGPHRATLRLLWEGAPLNQRASRGQQKTVAALILLAQIHLFIGSSEEARCVVAIDDLAAELDEDHREWLLAELLATHQQVLVTATQEGSYFPSGDAVKRFHMKQGVLSPA